MKQQKMKPIDEIHWNIKLKPLLHVDTHQRKAVFILNTHYPSGQTWASICSLSGYVSLV